MHECQPLQLDGAYDARRYAQTPLPLGMPRDRICTPITMFNRPERMCRFPGGLRFVMVLIMFREVYSEGSDGGTADCPRTSNDLARLPPVHTYAAAMHAYTNAIQFKLAVTANDKRGYQDGIVRARHSLLIPCNPAQHWCIYLCTNVVSISSYPFVLWPKEYWHSQHTICKSKDAVRMMV